MTGTPDPPSNNTDGVGALARRALVSYSRHNVEMLQTPDVKDWLTRLRDSRGRAQILLRLDRLSKGNPGDARPVGHGVSELRIHTGPGYRVYFLRDGPTLILLLCGGDKSSQSRDIKRAHLLAAQWHSAKEEQP